MISSLFVGQSIPLRALSLSFLFYASLGQAEQPKMTHLNTLKDAYSAAVKQSETLRIQDELLTQASEIDQQAKGALYPTLNGSYVMQNQPAPSSAAGNSFFPTNQTTTKLTLSQPLFRGLRDFAALRQKKNLLAAQHKAFLNAARQLFYDVATAYYNVLTYQHDEKNYLIELASNQKRLKELLNFYKIGRSQWTDVLTFKANIASLEAQLEVTRGQLETAKDILAYFTGWNRNFTLSNNEILSKKVASVETYLEQLDSRADVQTAIENVKSYEENIPIAFGQHLPSVDLVGNYYLTRPGVLSDVSWDVQVALTLPIFQGGIVQSQVRQARSISQQYQFQLSQARRLAEEEIRTFHNAVNTDTKQIAKLSELVQISEENAETNVKLYRNGLVTNLEVLQAITTYQDSKRQLEHQSSIALLNLVKLQAASGQRPEILAEEPRPEGRGFH